MKSLYKLIILTIGLWFVGCNQTTDILQQPISIEPSSHFQQALDNVFEVLANIEPSKYQALKSKRLEIIPTFYTSNTLNDIFKGNKHFKKVSTYSYEQCNIDTLLYIVNFGDEQGFAIISANEQLLGDMIFAIADTGSISINDFYIASEDTAQNDYSLNPSATVGTLVNNYLNDRFQFKKDNGTIDSQDLLGRFTYKYSSWTTSGKIYPRVKIKIGQSTPYNKYCFTSDGQQAVAGCVAIALVQLISANKYPSTIGGQFVDWDTLIETYKTNTTQRDILAKIIAEIGKQCNTSYGVQSSSSNIQNAKFCLNKYYKYSDLNITDDVTITTIQNMLSNLTPVHIRAHGHAWTIDGLLYQERTKYCYNGTSLIGSDIQKRQLVHCCYGWNGICDGYYNFKLFNVNAEGPIERESGETSMPSTASSVDNLNDGFQILTYTLIQ